MSVSCKFSFAPIYIYRDKYTNTKCINVKVGKNRVCVGGTCMHIGADYRTNS